jgi:uncharacterized damage-inducible protein DinB
MQPDQFKPFIPASREELLATFDRHVATARAEIARATDEALGKVWTVSMNGNTILSLPRGAVLRGMVMNHLIHHRAQLGVYLRLNDVAIPGLYGPSADEGTWGEQSQRQASFCLSGCFSKAQLVV